MKSLDPMEQLVIARMDNGAEINLPARMANRHGLITGASGAGKTITLQVMAENFSRLGVPVFVADVKGDVAGISQAGEMNSALSERLAQLGLNEFELYGAPVTFWDVFARKGHPIRTTISEMGPLLLSRMLGLNHTQRGTLNAVFKIADEQGLLLLDVKDLSAMLAYVGDNARALRGAYGNLTRASLGAIQRNLLLLQEMGAEKLFGEPAFDLFDFLRRDANGRGIINILAADELVRAPQMYATLMLWLLALLYKALPEAGDVAKPKLAFFFDEAHLLFADAPKPMIAKIEQMIRLIRSKGVGIYFVTHAPTDIPAEILGALSNRVQHALRAFTPRDQKNVRAAAQTFRPNPVLDLEQAILDLRVGEALVSFLDEQGMPQVTERAWIMPPHSGIGAISTRARYELMSQSLLAGKYEQALDRESAYELLQARAARAMQEAQAQAEQEAAAKQAPAEEKAAAKAAKSKTASGKKSKKQTPPPEEQGIVKDVANYAGQRMSQAVDKKARGMFGSFWGGK